MGPTMVGQEGAGVVGRDPAGKDALPKGDLRDWPASNAWADQIAHDLAATRDTRRWATDRPLRLPSTPDVDDRRSGWALIRSAWQGSWKSTRETRYGIPAAGPSSVSVTAGETLVLNAPVTPGRWKVRVYLTQSKAGGVVRIACESSRGTEFDLHGEGPVPTGPIELGTYASSWSTTVPVGFTLARGGDPDRLMVIGIDRLVFAPAPWARRSHRLGSARGEDGTAGALEWRSSRTRCLP